MVVEPPDTDDLSFPHLDDPAETGMPNATERAFESHYAAQLAGSTTLKKAIRGIERVYRTDPDATVAVSGGKDSMATLSLASQSSVDGFTTLHWDYGPKLVPRDVEREIVANIREFVPDERFFVCNIGMETVASYGSDRAELFRRQLHSDEPLSTASKRYDPRDSKVKPIGMLAPRLERSMERDLVGRQILGLRAGEAGSRQRKIDDARSELYGESLGQPAAFPIGEWSARDVWAEIVANDVPYADHYDRVAHRLGDGSPVDYEAGRMSAWFLPGYQWYPKDGVAEWENRHVER